MENTIIMIMLVGIFIAIIAMFITMVALIQNQNKKFDAINAKFDALKDELTNFKIEVNQRLAGVESEVKILSKLFGRFENDVKETNQRVNKIEEMQVQQAIITNKRMEKMEEIQNKRIDKIEIDNKEIIGKVLDKLQTA